jgi:hypothetical protein
MYYLELLLALKDTLSRWSQHLQSLTPTNPHWAGVVGYSPFSLCVIHKEGLCPSSGDINRLMMTCPNIHTYHSHFIPEGVAEASRIFLPDAHVLPKYLAMRNTAGVAGGKPIVV